MKGISLKSLCAAALAVTLSSCEKSAEIPDSPVAQRNVSEVVYPLLGNDMSTSIFPKQDNLPDAIVLDREFYPNAKVKVISEVCEEYLQQTKKLDISHIQEGKFREQVKNDDITVLFRNEIDIRGEGFIKLSTGPKTWWTHWNYSPYTESEYPTVLFAQNKNGVAINYYTLILNQPVKFFGFEIAPNTIGEDATVSVTYHEEDHYRSRSLCTVKQIIRTPSGARLIALKSDVPFEHIKIGVSGKQNGVGIANIRYALAR